MNFYISGINRNYDKKKTFRLHNKVFFQEDKSPARVSYDNVNPRQTRTWQTEKRREDIVTFKTMQT